MDSEVVGFPVKDLPERYSIGRTILYERIKALSLTLEKVSNRAYVSEEGLKLLDLLDTHIKNGGVTSEFLREHGLALKHSEQSGQTSRPVAIKRVEQFGVNEQIPEQWQIAYALTTIADRMTDQKASFRLPRAFMPGVEPIGGL